MTGRGSSDWGARGGRWVSSAGNTSAWARSTITSGTCSSGRPGAPPTGAFLLSLGAPACGHSALPRLVRGGRDPVAWTLSGLLALRRGDTARARPLLSGALAAGADTSEVRAALAAVAAREKRWADAAAQVRAAVAASRATLRHPYPREELSDALTRFALEGPRQVADTLMQEATERRDGWSKLHELSAIAALRAGRCEEAVRDRKSTRLNSSHGYISYAVFCLKK